MDSLMRIFPQQVPWPHQVQLNQRSEKIKKDKKASKQEDSVVALIQNAEQSRIPSPPRPDLQLGQVSPSDPRIRYFEYEPEREMSVWDAENEIQ